MALDTFSLILPTIVSSVVTPVTIHLKRCNMQQLTQCELEVMARRLNRFYEILK